MESIHESSLSIMPAIPSSPIWIDQDLFPEILKRLPVKSLCRFRCVCKYWKSLISSASFISLHSSTLPANRKPYLRRRRSRTDFKDPCGDYALCRPREELEHTKHQVPFPFRYRYARSIYLNQFVFIDLIKGLICISYSLDCGTHYMILWNPAIRKYLPLPCQPFPSTEILDLDLECTVLFYHHSIGFGYDASNDDFKVVRIWIPDYPCDCNCKSLLPACDVYSYREGVWRVSIAEDIKSCQIYGESGCFVNGAVHWVVADYDYSKHFVLMFDCEHEVFTTMELPPEIDQSHLIQLLEYGGLLSLLAKWDGHIELWTMEEHGLATTWKKLYTILDDTRLNWNIDVSQSSYQKLAPYGPDECIKFRWNDELFDDILSNNVYEESMLLMNDTNALSYSEAEIVSIDNSDPFQRVESSDSGLFYF